MRKKIMLIEQFYGILETNFKFISETRNLTYPDLI